MDFEDIIWIVVLFMGAFGGSLGKIVRNIRRTASAPISDQQDEVPSFQEELEFDDQEEFEENELFDFDDETAEFVETPKDSEQKQQEYFTYETIEEDSKLKKEDPKAKKEEPLSKKEEPKRAQAPQVVSEEALQPAWEGNFNLRQAMIYDTILHNNYIN